MKGKIDSNGRLYIERAGKMKEQYCPNHPDIQNCGDWCPCFEEEKKGKKILLQICACKYVNIIKDERK